MNVRRSDYKYIPEKVVEDVLFVGEAIGMVFGHAACSDLPGGGMPVKSSGSADVK
jgi:hypothetical protein